MATAGPMVADLRAESDELDALVAELPADAVGGPHTCAGLDDRPSDRAPAVDRPCRADRRHRRGRLRGGARRGRQGPDGFRRCGSRGVGRRCRRIRLLADWRETRDRLHDELLAVADGRKLPWFGPPMSAASMATARLMETWAHGLDVADALGVKRPATARLRSIAHIGVRTRDFAFSINGLTPPAEPFRVELRAPDSSTGRGVPTTPSSASRGRRRTSACWSRSDGRGRHLDVHRRRCRRRAVAGIAQAFAGPPGPGR